MCVSQHTIPYGTHLIWRMTLWLGVSQFLFSFQLRFFAFLQHSLFQEGYTTLYCNYVQVFAGGGDACIASPHFTNEAGNTR